MENATKETQLLYEFVEATLSPRPSVAMTSNTLHDDLANGDYNATNCRVMIFHSDFEVLSESELALIWMRSSAISRYLSYVRINFSGTMRTCCMSNSNARFFLFSFRGGMQSINIRNTHVTVPSCDNEESISHAFKHWRIAYISLWFCRLHRKRFYVGCPWKLTNYQWFGLWSAALH